MSAVKGSGVGKGVDEGKREGRVEESKIDLIYELFVAFGTDLHSCQMSLTSAVFFSN